MDPITLAIVAAVTAGVTKVGEQVIVDAYAALKAVLKRKFGDQSEVAKAVEGVEAHPESLGSKGTLQDQVAAVKADQDPEVLQAAEALVAKLKELPGGQSIVNQTVTGNRNIFSGTGDVTVTDSPRAANIVQQATGNYIAQASSGSTASVNVKRES